MIQGVGSGIKQCVVRIVDTDIAISLIACRRLVENVDCVVFACFSSAVSNKFYNINKIAENLGERKCRTLPYSYALTVCEIIFSLFNQDKCKFWDQWTESQEEEAMTTVFLELSEKLNGVTGEQITVIERFIGFMYYGRCINSIDFETSNIQCMEIYG